MNTETETPTPRTEMKCEVCGCFSSARICWHCSTNPMLATLTPCQQKLAEVERERDRLTAQLNLDKEHYEDVITIHRTLHQNSRHELLTAQARIVELRGALENLNAAAADAVTWCDDDEPYRVKFKKALVDSFDALSSTPPPDVVPRADAEGLSKALCNMLYDDPSKQENVIGSRNALVAYEATKAK